MKKPHNSLSIGRLRLASAILLLMLGLVTGCDRPQVRIVKPTGVVANYVIKAGTYQRLLRGEILDVFPRELEVHVGDEIVIENQDSFNHMIGPFGIRAGETLRHVWASAGAIEGECTFIPEQKVIIRVLP